MRSASFTPRSAIALALLVEAVEFIRDFEGDMSVDMAADLKHGNKHFDDSLAEIVQMRARVKWANAFTAAVKSAKVGETLYFDAHGLDVIDRGLEFLRDQLAEAITEPFWEIERKMNEHDVKSFYRVEIQRLREAVEHNIMRADVCDELLKEFRSIQA
jgi:hypothetical protein